MDTVTAQDRFGLVTINGVDYQIADIGLRMLEPRELYGCQGFPEDYIIDHDYTGKTYPRSEQVRRCGNAVCPPIPAALVRANLAKHEDRVRADRTAPVCMRSYSSADNTCGGAEREEKNENDRIFKNGI